MNGRATGNTLPARATQTALDLLTRPSPLAVLPQTLTAQQTAALPAAIGVALRPQLAPLCDGCGVLNLLQRASQALQEPEATTPASGLLGWAQHAAQRCHEALYERHWRDVPLPWRRAYRLSQHIVALATLRVEQSHAQRLAALQAVDLGLMMGAPLFDEDDDEDYEADEEEKQAKIARAVRLSKLASVLHAAIVEMDADREDTHHKAKREPPGIVSRPWPSTEILGPQPGYTPATRHEVARYALPSLQTFLQLAAKEIPFIITDAMGHWPATERWQDLAYLLVRRNKVVVGFVFSFLAHGL